MRAFCKPCWKIRRNNRPLRQQGPVTDENRPAEYPLPVGFFGSVPLSFGGKGGGGPLVLALRNAVETHSDARTRRHCLDVSVGSAIIFWCFFGKRKKFRAFCGNVGPNLVYYDYMEWSRQLGSGQKPGPLPGGDMPPPAVCPEGGRRVQTHPRGPAGPAPPVGGPDSGGPSGPVFGHPAAQAGQRPLGPV